MILRKLGGKSLFMRCDGCGKDKPRIGLRPVKKLNKEGWGEYNWYCINCYREVKRKEGVELG